MTAGTIVFVAEKRNQAKLLATHIHRRWPDSRVLVVLTRHIGGLYEFRYPRGLKISDFPHISDPSWKPRKFPESSNNIVVQIVDGELRNVSMTPEKALSAADEIWYACDADHSGAHSYHVLLSQTLGEERATIERPMLTMAGLDNVSLDRAFDTASTTANSAFQSWLRNGIAKRYFEYNFNVNALALLAPCLRTVEVDTSHYWLSKYSLQLLYGLQHLAPIGDVKLLRKMDRWVGTGRYAPTPMGSPASRHDIILGLERAGLLETDNRVITITDRGNAFLNLLHPDCNDPDLPGRLAHWQESWPASQPQIDRYLRTFFGRQKRFSQAG